MENATLHGWDPIETEEVVAPIMEFCSYFHHSLQNDEVKGKLQITGLGSPGYKYETAVSKSTLFKLCC
jgi:hypothetical protein